MKNLRSIDLNLLTIFDAILVHGSISAAAESLHMTQPAVSNALTRLRLTLNDELFIRTRQGMRPTIKALALHTPIQSALQQIASTVQGQTLFDPKTSQRVFRLALNDYAEMILLPPLLEKLQSLQTNMTIRTMPIPTDSIDALVKNEIDFIFDWIKPELDSIDNRAVGSDEVVVITRSDHPRADKRMTKTRFLKERHVILAQRYREKTVLETLLADRELSRSIIAEVSHNLTMASVVARTDSLAVMPKKLALYFRSLFNIKLHPFPFKKVRFSAYMSWRQANNEDLGHRWLKAQIMAIKLQH